MRVQGSHYRTVWIDGTVVRMIDQNQLPFNFSILDCPTCDDTCRAIMNMTVRGAGAIGATAAFAMAQGFSEAKGNTELAHAAKKRIAGTRPTAQNLFYAIERVFAAAIAASAPVKAAFSEAQAVADEDVAACQSIGRFGAALITPGMGIETHCNAGWLAFVDHGSALAPIYAVHGAGMEVFVFVDETRPRSQGARLTAWELMNEGVPHAIIADNAGAHFMSQGKISLVITGADRIAANGDAANKIGTLEKALCAFEFGIPFYIAAPFSTFDPDCPDGGAIPIENRCADEVLYQRGTTRDGRLEEIRVASPGSVALNPAFDVTPARLISGIITPRGIIGADRESIQEALSHDRRNAR